MNRYEAKEAYVDRIMRENASIDTLTEEQHSALSALARIRHEIHTNYIRSFEHNSDVEKYIDDESSSCVNILLKDAHLDPIDFNVSIEDIPSDYDYFEFLSKDERNEWDEKGGYSAWKEESGIFNDFCNIWENINDKIETYLREIDKIHGTNYAPSGMARLKI